MRQFVHALATKVLGGKDAEDLDLSSDNKAVACLYRCGDILKSTKKHGGAGGLDLGQVLLQRKKQTHAVKTQGKVGVPGVTDVPDHWKNAEAVVSPYNFRLRRKLEDMKATDLTYASSSVAAAAAEVDNNNDNNHVNKNLGVSANPPLEYSNQFMKTIASSIESK